MKDALVVSFYGADGVARVMDLGPRGLDRQGPRERAISRALTDPPPGVKSFALSGKDLMSVTSSSGLVIEIPNLDAQGAPALPHNSWKLAQAWRDSTERPGSLLWEAAGVAYACFVFERDVYGADDVTRAALGAAELTYQFLERHGLLADHDEQRGFANGRIPTWEPDLRYPVPRGCGIIESGRSAYKITELSRPLPELSDPEQITDPSFVWRVLLEGLEGRK